MSRLRVHSFAISIDGYGAGPNQNLENPLGVGGIAMHEWAFATRTFRQMHVAIAPALLGSGEALFTGIDLPALGYRCAEHVSTPNATHVVLTRQAS